MQDQQNGHPLAHRDTTYSQWQRSEGIPVYAGSYVEDLHTTEVADWPRVGQRGAFISLADQEQDDGWLIEIKPAGQTEPLQHLCEACIYVVEGRGATTIWQPGSNKKQTVEWQAGSLFSPPLNSRYQHFNLDGQRPARLFAATTAPLMMNIARNTDFIFNCPYVFSDRYDATDDYFTNPGQKIATRRWQTNLVPDTHSFKLEEWRERGAGGTNMFFVMSGNAMSAHISEFPVGSYKKAHRHGPGAHVFVLTGKGYTLLWPEGKERTRVDWKPGSIVVPPEGWFHQHFNSGAEPARYLALKILSRKYKLQPGKIQSDVPLAYGGWQIEYEDEDPEIRRIFEEECAKSGAEVRMPKFR